MQRWTIDQAWAWYNHQPWLVGCDFIPSTAINQLEMWQAESFDAQTLARELDWARSLGFNTLRVYLHDLIWPHDAAGFRGRIDSFLDLCAARGIRPMLVLFDDCWNSTCALGRQPAPRPGVHNSGWVQGPGDRFVDDKTVWPRLSDYVHGVLDAFGRDERVLMWDLYNEPGNQGLGSRTLGLLEAVFGWAREVAPSQPLTVGLWNDALTALNPVQLALSDVITFHNYEPADSLERQIAGLKAHGRPLICTEYMARPRGSRFESTLPVFKRERVGCLNWGLVSGKTQTIMPWGSPEGSPEPPEWFHDLFYPDGRPYRESEVAFIRAMVGA